MKFNLFGFTLVLIGVLLIMAGYYHQSPEEVLRQILQGKKLEKASLEGEEGEFLKKDDEGNFVPNTNPTTPDSGSYVVPI